VRAPGWTPPDGERAVGLEFYASTTAGAGEELKERAEDFRVQEISAYPVPDPEGPFTVLRVASRNWEQHELAQRIAQVLRLPPHAIDWAGTKDRRAIAERLFSYRGPPPERLDLPNVEVKEVYRARSGLVLGHHYGNVFEIRVPVRGMEPGLAQARWDETRTQLAELGGVPNLFGLQRFGEVRPVTHEVGRWIVRGDVARAVDVYLTAGPGDTDGPGSEARRSYAEHRDAARALREFPPNFRFERTLLDHLARGQPPSRALRALSRELRMLFVHAYQSLLFNRWVSARWAAGLSLSVPEPGDHLLRIARDGTVPGNVPVPVTEDNLPECRELTHRGRAQVAGPLIGFETEILPGAPGEITSRILREEAVQVSDFRLPQLPEVASRGSFRPLLVPLPPIGLRRNEDDDRGPSVSFTFALPKGAYATILLREFQKTGARPAA
jgi:tRNA pseudouridine13 synthase